MRFAYAEAMTDPAHYRPLVQRAEACGFDSFVVPDSIAYPRDSDSTYPYTPDGQREFLEDKPFLEPFALIAYLGALTERLRFVTFVLKLPVRHPVLVAKQASSVAVLTGDRLALGVGLSPWPEDFSLLGVPWAGRGRRMDEMIDILRGLGTGGYFSYDGETFQLPAVKMSPARPVPILVGGHTDPALRRAATRGDGWLHGGGTDDLAVLLDRLHALRAEVGRADEPFEIHVISLDAYTVDGVRRLADQGVTDVIVGFRNPYQRGPDTQPLADKLAAIEWYGENIIARMRA